MDPAICCRVRAVVIACALSIFSCGSAIPVPEYGNPSSDLLEEVPYPPPPARVELLPAPPNDRSVWIDGEWSWNGRRWAWVEGRWVMPPSGYRFTPWVVVRRRDGSFLYSPGFWRNPSGQIIDGLPPVEGGKAQEGNILRPEGHSEKTAPNVAPSAAPQVEPRSPAAP